MTFVAKYKTPLEEAIIDGTLAVIEDDFKAALDALYPTENYPTFAEVALGQVIGNEFPGLGINPSVEIEESDGGYQLQAKMVVEMHLGVIADGPDAVTRKLMRYMWALGEVFRVDAELRQGAVLTSSFPVGKVMGLSVDIGHEYLPVGSNGSIYFRAAQVQLKVNVIQIAG